jgi:hypothetical protein
VAADTALKKKRHGDKTKLWRLANLKLPQRDTHSLLKCDAHVHRLALLSPTCRD